MRKIISIFLTLMIILINTNLSFAEGLTGIGVQLQRKTDVYKNPYVVIVDVFNGSPAQKSGILGGDKIIEVNGKDVNSLNPIDLVNSIKGEKGTPVKLLIKVSVK